MLAALRTGDFDLAVGSRHVEGGDNTGLSSRWRHTLSDGGIRLAQAFLPVRLSDPMSGFFMLGRDDFDALAPHLTGQGFKILLDLVMSAPSPLRVREIPCQFHPRLAGESKLDVLVLVQFAGLLLDKVFRWLPAAALPVVLLRRTAWRGRASGGADPRAADRQFRISPRRRSPRRSSR